MKKNQNQNKNQILNIGLVLSIVISCCSLFLSFFYMSAAERYIIIFKYFSSFEFFVSIIGIVLYSILLGKTSKLKNVNERNIFKVFSLVALVFASLLFVLHCSSLLVYDFRENEFIITFVMIIMLISVIAFVLHCYGLKTLNVDPSKQLSELKKLLDDGLITNEEFEEKRSKIVENL